MITDSVTFFICYSFLDTFISFAFQQNTVERATELR